MRLATTGTTGFSPREKQYQFVTFPFLITRDLDFVGLKHIWAHVVSLSEPWRIHLLPGADDVAVKSSMKALMGAASLPIWLMDLGSLAPPT